MPLSFIGFLLNEDQNLASWFLHFFPTNFLRLYRDFPWPPRIIFNDNATLYIITSIRNIKFYQIQASNLLHYINKNGLSTNQWNEPLWVLNKTISM